MANTTQLDAVKLVIRSLGGPSINSLEDGDEDVLHAIDYTATAKRTILAYGWWFNKRKSYTLVLDNSGYAYVPNDALDIDASDTSANVVVDGNRMYDAENQTYVFSEPLECDIVFDVPWESLPYIAFMAIAHRAATDAFFDLDGDSKKISVMEARATQYIENLRGAELINGDHNIFNRPDISAKLGKVRP